MFRRFTQITFTSMNYSLVSTNYINCMSYLENVFASAEVSNNCPNIENITVSPNIDLEIIQVHDPDVFFQQKVLLDEPHFEIYANNIKLSTGKTCKLRSIRVQCIVENPEQLYQRILNLYGNLEQISVFNPDENFFKYLNQFMENGLKDLEISVISGANLRIAKKYCNIWKDLRVLSLTVGLGSNEDIALLNKLQLPKITKLKIDLGNNCFAHLNENICNSVIACDVPSHFRFQTSDPSDYRLLSKFKNLQRFYIRNLESLQVIAKSGLNTLRRVDTTTCDVIYERCYIIDSVFDTCDLQELPQLLINNCKQLTYIDIKRICYRTAQLIWKALRHCKAAKIICIFEIHIKPLTITYEDVEAICHLPNLHDLSFCIPNIKVEEDTGNLLREQMDRAMKEHTDLQFKYTFGADFHSYSLHRINF